ncbi:molybdopterin-dependent oxidoreductase, partial [Acinetobacter baumannii]
NLAAVAFNTTLAGIEDADAILIYGSQVRDEAPLLNVRLRKAVKKGAKVFVIGPACDATYPVTHLGDDAATIGNLSDDVVAAFSGAARP